MYYRNGGVFPKLTKREIPLIIEFFNKPKIDYKKEFKYGGCVCVLDTNITHDELIGVKNKITGQIIGYTNIKNYLKSTETDVHSFYYNKDF